MVQAKEAGNELGDQSGGSGPSDSEMENQHKQKIQCDIGQGRHDHGVKRRLSVPQRAQHTGQQIVGHDDGNPPEHDPKIQQGVSKDFLRGLQKNQDRTGKELADSQQDKGGKQREDGGVPDHPAKLLMLSGTEFLRHENGKPLGKALDNPKHHPVQPVGGAKGGKRIHAKSLAHHHGVNNRIKLLKNIARHQGQCKGKNQGSRPSLGHVFDS